MLCLPLQKAERRREDFPLLEDQDVSMCVALVWSIRISCRDLEIKLVLHDKGWIETVMAVSGCGSFLDRMFLLRRTSHASGFTDCPNCLSSHTLNWLRSHALLQEPSASLHRISLLAFSFLRATFSFAELRASHLLHVGSSAVSSKSPKRKSHSLTPGSYIPK